MNSRKPPSFFDIEKILTGGEKKELHRFAQSNSLPCSKNTLQLFQLLTKVPEKHQPLEKKIRWLQKKIFPKDNDDRNFRRTIKQAEEIFFGYSAFHNLQQKPDRHLFELEALLHRSLDRQFESRLAKLEENLWNNEDEFSSNYLRSFLKEDLKHRFLSKQRRIPEYQFHQPLQHLNQFFLLEKFKYGISYLQLAKIKRANLPDQLKQEIEFLAQHHVELIQNTPILKLYYTLYQLYLAGGEQNKDKDLLLQLDEHSGDLSKPVLKQLYNLAGNYLVAKINASNQSLTTLKAIYESYFTFNQLLTREDLLKEGERIPQGRFQNVIASALNTGKTKDIHWAEDFLHTHAKLVHPQEQETLFNFCRGAICFYKKEYEECLSYLQKVPYINRFYYCDIKTLEIRAHFEFPQDYFDYHQTISGVIRTIRNDQTMSDNHKLGYLNFFSAIKQLFHYKYTPYISKEALETLKKSIWATHPMAQKKWLMEKWEEIEPK